MSEDGLEGMFVKVQEAQRFMRGCSRACTLFKVGQEDRGFLLGIDCRAAHL